MAMIFTFEGIFCRKIDWTVFFLHVLLGKEKTTLIYLIIPILDGVKRSL